MLPIHRVICSDDLGHFISLHFRQLHQKLLAPCHLRSPLNVLTFGVTQAKGDRPALHGTEIIAIPNLVSSLIAKNSEQQHLPNI